MKFCSNRSLTRCQPWLGTYVQIGVEPENGLPLPRRLRGRAGEGGPRAIDAAFDRIAEIHRLMSFHDPESDISKLNASVGSPGTELEFAL